LLPGQRLPPSEHSSRLLRGVFVVLGTLALVLGVIGIFVPLLPTTPFILLAAAFYARGSRRFHHWLLNQRTFGPIVREWEEHRAIPYRTKLFAVALMSLTFGVSIVFFVEPSWLKLTLAAVGVARPSRLNRPRDVSRRR
jgi:uncharacterized membrane protein YbaN (DUF454 family)